MEFIKFGDAIFEKTGLNVVINNSDELPNIKISNNSQMVVVFNYGSKEERDEKFKELECLLIAKE